MTLKQHIVVDVSDEAFITEPYTINITGGIDISGLGRTIIRTDGTTEITDSIKLKNISDNTIKITPNDIDISGIGNINMDTLGNAVFSCNNDNNNTVTISSETIIIDTSDNTGLHIKKQPRHDANSLSGLLNNGDIVISDHGNCSATGDIAGIIQFEASPFDHDNSDNSQFVNKCGQIALTHEGAIGNDTWGLTFNLLGDDTTTNTYELLKLSGKNMVGVCGKDPERNLDVSGSFRVTNSDNYLNIDNNGDIESTGNLYIHKKMGIGTTSPNALLHIFDSISQHSPAPDRADINQLRIDSLGYNTGLAFKFKGLWGTNPSWEEYDFDQARISTTGEYFDSKLHFETAYHDTTKTSPNFATLATRMTIDHGGNVGIGTTVPSNKLEVHGGPLGLALVDPTNYHHTSNIDRDSDVITNNLLFKQDTNRWNDSKYINTTAKISSILEGVTDATDAGKTSIGFFTATGGIDTDGINTVSLTEKMRITSTGNVGIGTTDPTKYYYNQPSGGDFPSGEKILTIHSPGPVDTARLVFSCGDYHPASIFAEHTDNGSTYLGFTTKSDAWQPVAERMRITHDGKVGIGITNPGAPLEVQGYDEDHGFGLRVRYNDTYKTDYRSNGININPGNTQASSFVFEINDNPKMIINSDGHVGIGVTNPTSKLHVNGDIESTGTVRVKANTFMTKDGYMRAESYYVGNMTSSRIYGDSTYPDYVVIDKNLFIGNIAKKWGSNNSNNKLEVDGNIKLRENWYWNAPRYISAHWRNTSVQRHIGIEFNQINGKNGVINFIANTSNQNNINDSGRVDLMTIQQNGNVGIGTTNPTSKLSVVGNLQVDGNSTTYGNVGIVTNATNPGCLLDIVNTNDSGIAELRVRGNSQGTGKVYVGQSDSYGGGITYKGPDDEICLFRRNNGTDTTVLRFPFHSNNVTVGGTIYASFSGNHNGNTGEGYYIAKRSGVTSWGHTWSGSHGTHGVGFCIGDNDTGLAWGGDGWLAAYSNGSRSQWLNCDSRGKKNIIVADDLKSWNLVKDVEVYWFEYINKYSCYNGTTKIDGRPQMGFIAQQLQKVLPYAVNVSTYALPNYYKTIKNFIWEEIEICNDDIDEYINENAYIKNTKDKASNKSVYKTWTSNNFGFIKAGQKTDMDYHMKHIDPKNLDPNSICDFTADMDHPEDDSCKLKRWKLTILDENFDINLNEDTGFYKFYVTDKSKDGLELDNKTGICRNVVLLKDKKSFLFEKKWNQIFLYGKEVNNHLDIDDSYFIPMHHSAIQQIIKNNEGRDAEINNLKSENIQLKDTVSSLTSRLEALEKLVLK